MVFTPQLRGTLPKKNSTRYSDSYVQQYGDAVEELRGMILDGFWIGSLMC